MAGGVVLKLIHGDCLEVMRGMDAESVDAIVTDPPAGIAFMLKEWDKDKGGRDSWIAWMQEIAAECLRLLKPGGHALVWAIPRTSHWTATAWENAGFEVRDRIAHCFGCLSEDTELLIDGQWEPYHKAIEGSLALCYNVDHDTFKWELIQNLYVYDYCDTAFRIVSDSTEQIVSRNHRCIVERDGRAVFQYVEALECEEGVPILEDVQILLDDLPLPYKGASGKESKLPIVRESKGWQVEQGKVQDSKQEMSTLPQRVSCEVQSWQCEILQQVMQGEVCYCTHVDSQQVRPDGDGAEGRKEPCMERRCNLLPQARKLQTDQVCQVLAGIYGNGTEGRLCNGAPSFCCSSHRSTAEASGNSAPQKPRPSRQFPSKLGTLQEQPGSQAVRASRYTQTDLARVEPTHYTGKVWCIQVPSGAFVARRNGKVFVTGNSGFPKSLDVIKAIDRMAGAELSEFIYREYDYPDSDHFGKKRTEYKGSRGQRCAANGHFFTPENNRQNESLEVQSLVKKSLPATPAAKQWDGWGTALKPAIEDWWLLRKPLDGTVAQNVMKWGCGGLNVDGCRVGSEQRENPQAGFIRRGRTDEEVFGGTDKHRPEGTLPVIGRFPANLILSYPEDEYGLRDDVTPEQLRQLAEWMDENT